MRKIILFGSFLIVLGISTTFFEIRIPSENEFDAKKELAHWIANIDPMERHYIPEIKLKFYESLLSSQSSLILNQMYAQCLSESGKHEEAIWQIEIIKKNFEKEIDQKTELELEINLIEFYLRKCFGHPILSSISLENSKQIPLLIQKDLNYTFSKLTTLLKNPQIKRYSKYKELKERQILLSGLVKVNINEKHIQENKNYTSSPQDSFANLTALAGLVDHSSQKGGAILDDFNNDGQLDIFYVDMGIKGQTKYFINKGNGKFEDYTDAAGLSGFCSGLNVVSTDYNNDGFLDVFIPRGSPYDRFGLLPNSLLRNNGDNSFTDVTFEAGLLTRYPSRTAIWADINLDGWLDLFVGNQQIYDRKLHSELYLNNRDGSFTNITKMSGMLFKESVSAANWLDYNKDGRPDLFIAVSGGKDMLWQNMGLDSLGNIQFTEVGLSTNFPKFHFTQGGLVQDFNQDGWDDLVLIVSENIWDTNDTTQRGLKFLRNNQNGSFWNVTTEYKWASNRLPNGVSVIDFNNDGKEDYYLSQGFFLANLSLMKAEEKLFDPSIFSNLGFLVNSHMAAVGDFDLDGDQDIYLVTGGEFPGEKAPNLLLSNPGSKSNWINLKLIGKHSNKAAIGTKVELTILNGESPEKIYRTIDGGSILGTKSLALTIGLGEATEIKLIEVRWLGSGIWQSFQNIEVNKNYVLTEAGPLVEAPLND